MNIKNILKLLWDAEASISSIGYAIYDVNPQWSDEVVQEAETLRADIEEASSNPVKWIVEAQAHPSGEPDWEWPPAQFIAGLVDHPDEDEPEQFARILAANLSVEYDCPITVRSIDSDEWISAWQHGQQMLTSYDVDPMEF